jgi:SAM-dependent methyltransferase
MDTDNKMNKGNILTTSGNKGFLGQDSIKLARLWHQCIKNATFSAAELDFWDNWAKSLPTKRGPSGYVKEVLKRLDLAEGDSILDVGAGTGAMAIPLAQKGYKVTALDQSPYMLDIIHEKARQQRLDNLSIVNIDWEEVRTDKDVEPHDVVLVSRSMPARKDILSSLKSIDMTARRLCYITWKADSHDALEVELCNRLGIAYRAMPDYMLLYNLIYSLGIRANVEVFKTTGERIYGSIDDAYIQIIRSHPIHTDDEKQLIMSLLAENLEYSKGLYIQHINALWALIWWSKEWY